MRRNRRGSERHHSNVPSRSGLPDAAYVHGPRYPPIRDGDSGDDDHAPSALLARWTARGSSLRGPQGSTGQGLRRQPRCGRRRADASSDTCHTAAGAGAVSDGHHATGNPSVINFHIFNTKPCHDGKLKRKMPVIDGDRNAVYAAQTLTLREAPHPAGPCKVADARLCVSAVLRGEI